MSRIQFPFLWFAKIHPIIHPQTEIQYFILLRENDFEVYMFFENFLGYLRFGFLINSVNILVIL